MRYSIGDKFLIGDIETVVCYTNQGRAWVAPLADGEVYKGRKLYASCTFVVIDEKGKLPDGKKALPITNISFCGAI